MSSKVFAAKVGDLEHGIKMAVATAGSDEGDFFFFVLAPCGAPLWG